MALDPLATTDDLDARGMTTPFDGADTFLDVASSIVREAAGSPISQVTSTVTLDGYWNEKRIRLPGGPVVSVDTVTIDGDTVVEGDGADGWRLAGEDLWRAKGWAKGPWPNRPSNVEVTYTHGLEQVPEHIVDLVCSMVAAAKSALDAGDDGSELALNNGRVQSVTIDGFSESYGTSGEALEAVTAMTLPHRTRVWLAEQFGNGARTGSTR